MTEKLAYSIKDAVAVTGIGRTTLYSHIKVGTLKARHVGGRTLILPADLVAFLNDCPAPGSCK